jgi:hypothetical protein
MRPGLLTALRLTRLALSLACATGCAAALEPGADDAGPAGGDDLLVGNSEGPGGVSGGGGSSGGAPSGIGGVAVPPTGGTPAADAFVPPPPAGEFSAESVALCGVINAYRQQSGLPPVPVSTTLMRVAAGHVADLVRHPELSQPPCNLHSWSDEGTWGGCCYTEDHAQAQCMWDKPREFSGGTYAGDGFEIAAFGQITPQQALQLWQLSAPHHEVILNGGLWSDLSPWPAMGCGLLGSYAVAWFGSQVDPLSL